MGLEQGVCMLGGVVYRQRVDVGNLQSLDVSRRS